MYLKWGFQRLRFFHCSLLDFGFLYAWVLFVLSLQIINMFIICLNLYFNTYSITKEFCVVSIQLSTWFTFAERFISMKNEFYLIDKNRNRPRQNMCGIAAAPVTQHFTSCATNSHPLPWM